MQQRNVAASGLTASLGVILCNAQRARKYVGAALCVMESPYRLTKECWQILTTQLAKGKKTLLLPQEDLQCLLGE